MSTVRSESGPIEAPMIAGSMVGRSPCTLTTTSWCPAGSTLSSASARRSEPDGWSARVITAMPPAASTAWAIAAVSVATTTGPIPASMARRQTWTIIASPAISASGLFGRRVAARRAGISTRGSDMKGSDLRLRRPPAKRGCLAGLLRVVVPCGTGAPGHAIRQNDAAG